MKSITFSDGSVKSPPKLDVMGQSSLCEWLPSDELSGEVERYGHWRNVYRAAESYGPPMIAMLMEAGTLQSEQDPLEVLRDLLKITGF